MTNTGPSAPYVSQSLRWREDMTQHQLPAALSAPLRVVQYENRAGRTTFECDGVCRCLDSSARNARPAVARQLDTSLERVLVKRPAEQEDIHG